MDLFQYPSAPFLALLLASRRCLYLFTVIVVTLTRFIATLSTRRIRNSPVNGFDTTGASLLFIFEERGCSTLNSFHATSPNSRSGVQRSSMDERKLCIFKEQQIVRSTIEVEMIYYRAHRSFTRITRISILFYSFD